MKRLTSFFCLFTLVTFGQIDPNNISYEYFYKPELQQIVKLKKEVIKQPYILNKRIKLAEKYQEINCEDSSYATYYKAFKINSEIKQLTNQEYFDLILELHKTETSKNRYTKSRGFFLNELQKIAKNDLQIAEYDMELAKMYFIDSTNHDIANYYFEKIKNNEAFTTNLKLQNRYYLNSGNFFTSINQFVQANNHLLKSLQLAQIRKDTLLQVFSHINLGVNYKKQKLWNKALSHFNIAEKIPFKNYKPKIYRIIYSNKIQVYKGLQNKDLLAQATEIHTKFDSLINDFQRNSNFYEIDVQYQVHEKEQKLQELEQNQLKNKLIYGIIIFIIFLLALYSVIRWKKVDAKKKELFTEKTAIEILHTSTVEELEKIKQLVIEDHIVLKNKTKIYLNELVYVKADDHYLELITSGKKEFVRGKISELLSQLPPNFAQCHRSYVVNKNYVLSISNTSIELKNKIELPLSRNYKKNFNNEV